MSDAIISVGAGSVVQHGKHNDRVYLLKLTDGDIPTIADELIRLAQEEGYSKIFCKIPQQVAPLFFAKGYVIEGYIPKLYRGKDDAFFVSKFMYTDRQSSIGIAAQLEDLYNLAQITPSSASPTSKEDRYSFRMLGKSDVQSMVEIYLDVFVSYPFPIFDPAYILETMDGDVQYFGAFLGDDLAAIASSEIDHDAKNAEMTDFVTQKRHAGHGLAYRLLDVMEQQMKYQGILTLYTIARVNSIPMNKTFLRMGYKYSGLLINNTNIAGSIESMMLLYKSL